MRKPIRLLTSLALAGALAAPLALQARDKDDHDRDKHRVYDRAHRDYHDWDDRENNAYRNWYTQTYRDRDYRDYNRLNRRDQGAYWNWRHSHPDNDHDRDDRH